MGVPLFLAVAAFIFGLDQFTKRLALAHLPRYGSVTLVPGCFQLTLTTNTGAAFGLFQTATPVLALIALGAAVAIVVYVARRKPNLPLVTGFALALPLGGTLGNFADRASRHYVVDFFDAYIGPHHWPIFNVADSSICVGVAILMITMVRSEHTVSSATPSRSSANEVLADNNNTGAEPSTPVKK